MIPVQILSRRRASGSIYGVERLRNVADPSFTYLIGDMDLHSSLPLQNQIRPCKSNDARQVVNFLDPTDLRKNTDGTTSVIDGTDGLDVMCYNPGLWAIFGGSDPIYERWIISDSYFTYGADEAIEINPFLETPDNCTIDRTSGKSKCVYSEVANLAGSGSGLTAGGLGYPRTSTSRYGYEIAAELKGAAWESLSYIDLMYTACMMYIEYRTKNLKLTLGTGASNWGSAQWNAYNAYYPAFKILEAQLALSATPAIIAKKHITGIFTKHFEFPYLAGTQVYDTQRQVYRSKAILWGHIWSWRARVEMEVQSAAAGGKSLLYIAYPSTPIDKNRIDANFNFKDAYKLVGEVPRIDAWVKTIHTGTLAGNNLSGAGETTYACSYNWNSSLPASGVVRRGFLFGANLLGGGSCALGSAYSNDAPSSASSIIGGGFRANVAG